MEKHSDKFIPITLSKKDFAFIKAFEKNWHNSVTKPDKFDNEQDVNKVMESIVKREMMNCLYSLLQKTVQVPIEDRLVNVSINNIKLNLKISINSLGKQDTVWFLKTIQNSLESKRIIPLPEFLALAMFGVKSEPTFYKILYDQFKELAPNRFLFNEFSFSTSEKNIRNKVEANRNYSNNVYSSIVDYWNCVNNPDMIHMSTFIVYLISNYYTAFDSFVNMDKGKDKIQYDRNKFAFAIKQLLSESSSTIDERKEKVDCVRNALEISKAIKTNYEEIYDILSSKKNVKITQSQRIFYEYCSNHISVIDETSALAALIKV